MIAAGTVALLVGTRKGAFIVTSDERRADWSISDINIPGGDVFHLAYDARDGTLYAAANSVVFGPDIQKSTDLGATWEPCRSQPRFPEDANMSVSRVWHVLPGRESEPGASTRVWSRPRCSGARTAETRGPTYRR